jgi:serpin B
MTTARNTFTARLYDKLADTHAGKNLFLSPFGIQVALAMCALGAKGETRRVLADLIGAPENVDEQNRQYANLLKSIHGDGQRPFQLVTANALWGQQGYRFKAAFQEAIADFYDGALHVVDFRTQPDEAVKTINAWVSDKTSAKINELINRNLIDKDTRLILTNAIYFKGPWEGEFEKANTKDQDWHGPGGISKVPTMHQKGDYLYYENNDFQALDLPYKGRQLSMLVVLPRKKHGMVSQLLGRKKDDLTALEGKWAAEGAYEYVTGSLHPEEVLVAFPRFKMETAFTLKPVLCALGAEVAFGDQADFSGIGEEPLKISEVVHKAFVEVNEEGTEAAAATAVHMAPTMAAAPTRRPEPKVFKADHPFLFFIRDRDTNTVLFSGRVLDPR